MSRFIFSSYQGRDGIIKSVSYAFMLAGGLTSGDLRRKFLILSKEMSQCRVVLRLLDDWPLLERTLQYGLGNKEPDTVLRLLNVLKNILDHLFYPVEHLAWLGDKRVLRIQSTERLWLAAKCLWALSLYCNCARALRVLHNIQKKEKQGQCETVESRRVKAQLMLSLSISILNFVNAVSCLPNGILWAGRLKQWHTGAIGLLASLLGIFQLLTTI